MVIKEISCDTAEALASAPTTVKCVGRVNH